MHLKHAQAITAALSEHAARVVQDMTEQGSPANSGRDLTAEEEKQRDRKYFALLRGMIKIVRRRGGASVSGKMTGEQILQVCADNAAHAKRVKAEAKSARQNSSGKR